MATAESQQLIPRAYREKCSVQLGVGLSREYLGWTSRKRNGPRVPRCDCCTSGDCWSGRALTWPCALCGNYATVSACVRLTIVGDGPARTDPGTAGD